MAQQLLKLTFVNKASIICPFTIPSSENTKQIFPLSVKETNKIIWLETEIVACRNTFGSLLKVSGSCPLES